jgi:pantothenate kinase
VSRIKHYGPACADRNQPLSVSSGAIPVSFGMNTISFQPFIIGVAGGSGSGKSTVSQSTGRVWR